MKRIFIFSYHGSDTFQTSFNRLKSFAETLAEEYHVFFIHGQLEESLPEANTRYTEIIIPYRKGIFRDVYTSMINKEAYSIARLLLLAHYFIARREILDLHYEFFKYIDKRKFQFTSDDIVLASYPSWAIHKLGLKLKRRFGCKLILDFRDPGVFGYQHVSDSAFTFFLRKLFMQRSEIRNLEVADKCIAASESIKNCFKREYQNKFEVIRNGAAINLLDEERIRRSPAKFKIIYIGQVYEDQFDNLNFFEAVKAFLLKRNLRPSEFEIRFIGGGAFDKLETISKRLELSDFISISKRIPIAEVYKECFSASAFLQLKYGDRNRVVASKQYDYVALQKPIILPSSDDGDIEDFINVNEAGYVCNSPEEVESVLSALFDKWKSGESTYMGKPPEEVYRISRQYEATKLVSLIREIS